MEMYDTLTRHFSMLTYIYLNEDGCWVIPSIPMKNKFKLHISLSYTVSPEHVDSEE